MKTENDGRIATVMTAALLVLAIGVETAQADFRSTRTGARPRSMGSAFVSVADDACAVHWNPAGLTRDDRLQAMVTRNWSYGVADLLRDDALTVVAPSFGTPVAGRLHAAGSFVRRAIRDVYYEDTYELALAAELPFVAGLSAGVTGKIFRLSAPAYEQYNDPNYLGPDTGYAADLGVLYNGGPNWSVGAAFYNLNEPYLQLIGTTTHPDPVYRAYAVGGSYLFRDALLLTGDVRSGEYGYDDVYVNGGAEIWFFDALALRAGLFEGNVTMGVGLQDQRWRADFALETHEEVGNAYLLSFTLRN
ncbi:hypothetical protein H8E07_07810 [bacterium]|nr:hypothetical protein [bacterium]